MSTEQVGVSVAHTLRMDTRTLIRITFTAGMLAAAGFGCSLVGDDGDASNDAVSEGDDLSGVLKSTLQITGGCSAVKVGPKHLLLAARCVSGKDAFAAGKTISFT